MELLTWCKQQPWWPIVEPMLEAGMLVALHVPNHPPKQRLTQRSTGGVLILEHCSAPWWHIHHAWPLEASTTVEVIDAFLKGGKHSPRMGEA